MEITIEIEKSLQEWYKSFTFGNITYKDGTNFISRIKPKEEQKKSKINKNKEVLTFGKYKGKDINWVIENDNSYYNWCLENIKGFKTKYSWEGYTLSDRDSELQKKYDKIKPIN